MKDSDSYCQHLVISWDTSLPSELLRRGVQNNAFWYSIGHQEHSFSTPCGLLYFFSLNTVRDIILIPSWHFMLNELVNNSISTNCHLINGLLTVTNFGESEKSAADLLRLAAS